MKIYITVTLLFLMNIGYSQIELSAGPAFQSFTFNEQKLNLIGARLQFGNPVVEENMTITLAVDYMKADTLSFIVVDPTFRYYFNDKASGYFIGGTIGLLFNLESNFRDYIVPMKISTGYRQHFNDNFFVDFSPFLGYQNSSLNNFSVVYGANANFGIMF